MMIGSMLTPVTCTPWGGVTKRVILWRPLSVSIFRQKLIWLGGRGGGWWANDGRIAAFFRYGYNGYNSIKLGPCIIQTSKQRKQFSFYYTSIQTSETWPLAPSSTWYSLRITCYVVLLAIRCEPYTKLPILVLIQLRKGFLDGLINRGAYI